MVVVLGLGVKGGGRTCLGGRAGFSGGACTGGWADCLGGGLGLGVRAFFGWSACSWDGISLALGRAREIPLSTVLFFVMPKVMLMMEVGRRSWWG